MEKREVECSKGKFRDPSNLCMHLSKLACNQNTGLAVCRCESKYSKGQC